MPPRPMSALLRGFAMTLNGTEKVGERVEEKVAQTATGESLRSPPWLTPLLEALAVPVMGCTEPASVALAAALAAAGARGEVPGWLSGNMLGEPAESVDLAAVERLRIRATPSLYKNALAVGIPGTEGGVGIYLAASLGPYLSAGAGINLLKGVGSEALGRARELRGTGRLGLTVESSEAEVLRVEAEVIAVVEGERHVGEAVIAGRHDRVVRLCRDGKPLFELTDVFEAADPVALQELSRASLPDLVSLARGIDARARAHMLRGVQLNREAAEEGIQRRLGMAVGAHLRDLQAEGVMGEDLPTEASALTAGATDARMSGHDVEIMSSSGSGNQGIMAVVPASVMAEALGSSEDRLAEATALAHLVTGVMTQHTGLLSSLCGCVVKAGLGATASCAFLLGLDEDGIFAALRNMAGNMTGEICDGAKVGCAVKLATAARAAVLSAFHARDGVSVPPNNGILAATASSLFENIGDLARAMSEVDRTIVRIMERKQLHEPIP